MRDSDEHLISAAKAAIILGRLEDARELLLPRAEDEAEACYLLAIICECDENGTTEEGLRWMLAAARQGHPKAGLRIATTLGADELLELTPALHEHYLAAALRSRLPEAMMHMAVGYATGEWDGWPSRGLNPAKAYTWYRRAAELGDVTAQYETGLNLLYGQGVKPDLEQGMRWLQCAALAGEASAAHHLAQLYGPEEGLLEEDPHLSQIWRELGDLHAAAEPHHLFSDELE